MRGKYQIEVYDKYVAYRFEVRRNITVIQGDSGTGKTQLIRLISDYNRGGTSSGVVLRCEKECIALNVLDWEAYLRTAHEKIIFVDENSAFIRSKTFAEIVNSSDNYYVLIYRDSLPQLSYSIQEIYGMRESRDSQKYVHVGRVYNELYPLYNLKPPIPLVPETVVTEDSNAGNDCFVTIFPNRCCSAKGRSRVVEAVTQASKRGGNILAVVDGAAFGADMQQFMRKSDNLPVRCVLFAPESFEYIRLSSGILQVDRDKLENTYNYADSTVFSSWERYYTRYLMDVTEGTIYQYQKRSLNKNYLTEGNLKKIIEQIPKAIKINWAGDR